MRFAPVYWNEAEPAGETLDQLLYRLRRLDAEDGLIFDRVSLDDLMEMADEGPILFDALVTTRVLLDRKMTAIERVMNAASRTLDVTASQVSDPFKRQGVINVAVVFELSDGQTITVVFHNPDAKNVKALKPSDDLISWKWMLNKRDVSILVAPEQKEAHDAREVARRIIKLASKNSAAFVRNNRQRAAKLEQIRALTAEIGGLETECKDLERQVELARLEAEDRAVNPEPGPIGELPTTDKPAIVETSGTELGEFPETPEGLKALREDETDIDPAAIARVDAAYRFENATDEFKAWVAESVDSTQGPFATARAMEERAKAHGATIEWGLFEGAALDAVYVEDDDEGDVALDASEHWKKQPRDKKSGRWVLRRMKRMKRMKQAAKKAGETVAGAARKASDYVAQALKGGGKGGGTSAAGKLAHGADEALEGGAKIDPGLAAIHELVGGVKTVARAFDSAVALDAVDDDGYVGKIRKDGEVVGRVDIQDDGKAMVFVGAEGGARVKAPSLQDMEYTAVDAELLIDLLFSEANAKTIVPDGAENTVKTAKGTKIETGFAVVEADTLIVSHDNQGNPNPDYPAELQPRDRGRETSIAWIRKTANQLDPDSLGKTRRADTGAPIVGPDRVVESGNGRTMAIQEAYRTGKADEYREWLIEEAESFGLNPDRIRAMKRPVLVRVRTSDIDRRTFAIEANQDDKLAMTATEKARSDADRLDEALLSKLADDGDLLSAANRDFIRGFMASLGDAEAAQYITTDGQPTAALIARVQAAVFAKAYSDDRLLELTADASKPEVANILNALNAAALEFIRAQAAAKGATDALTSEIADSVETSLNAQAVQAIIDATNLVRKARAEGQSVEEVVNQRGLFDDIPPATAAMALFIHKNNRSAKRMATAFRAMARHVRQEAERWQTVDLFGDLKPATLEDIIGAANRELDREYGEGQFAIETLDLFATPSGTDSAPSPIERLKDMLLRGDIGPAVDFLGTLDQKKLFEALLKNGFSVGGDTTREILGNVQQDLIRAAKLKTDGYGLRELDAQPPAVEPEPAAPDLAEIAARLIADSDPNQLEGGADPTPGEMWAMGLHNYDDRSTLNSVLRNLFPGLADKSYQSAMSRAFQPEIELYDSQKVVKEAAKMARYRADREAAAVAKTQNFTPANAKVEPRGTRVKMDGRWSSRLTEALAAATGTGVSTGRSAGKMQGEVHTADGREFKGHGALGKYLLEKLNGMIERGEPVDLEPIRQATYAGGGGINPFEIVGPDAQAQPPADPQKGADRALFQSVIDGAVPDMLSPDLGREMIAAYERNQADADLIALAEQAMDIYEQAMLDAEIPQ